MRARPGQRGFTLLEVVVAFAILVLSLGALFESFSMTLRRSEKARNLERAGLLIESVRDQIGITVPLDPADTSENEDDCRWRVHGRIMERPASIRVPTAVADSISIDVDCGVAGAVGRAHLDTVELAPVR